MGRGQPLPSLFRKLFVRAGSTFCPDISFTELDTRCWSRAHPLQTLGAGGGSVLPEEDVDPIPASLPSTPLLSPLLPRGLGDV